jgi:hypothetical protein
VARVSPFEVEGFGELNRKLRVLESDITKRSEILKIIRRQAKPALTAYRAALPKDSGTLEQSTAIRTVSRGRSGGNPIVNIRPGKRGRYDGFYKFMVIRKGAAPGSTARGSRKAINIVVPTARDRALQATGQGVIRGNEQATARYIQRAIDRLSK